MSLFETEFSLFDPSTQFDESNFLSFSSLIELCPPALDSNELNTKGTDSNPSSSTSSPSLSEPSDVLNDDFQPPTPKCGEVGIFHTPPKSTNGYEECDSFTPEHTLSSSMDAFVTPIKSLKSSISGYGQYGYNLPTDSVFLSSSHSNFPWDDASSNLSGATYQPLSVAPRAMRVASNPTLDAPRNPRFVKQVVSMPSLKEEALNTESDWDNSKSFVTDEQQGLNVDFVSSRAPVDGFDNVFGGFGTGENGVNTAASTLTFQSPESLDLSTQSTVNTMDIRSIPSSSTSMPMSSWQPQTSTMQDHVGLFPVIETPQPNIHVAGPIGDFTINPKEVMCFDEGESLVRPSTAPGLRDEEPTVLLRPPISEPMNRSLSAGSYKTSKNGPLRDLFSYAPQQLPTGTPGLRPLYTCEPSPLFTHTDSSNYSRAMPATPTRKPRRTGNSLFTPTQVVSGQGLGPSAFPPTPDSPGFPFTSPSSTTAPPMLRIGSNPLPMSFRKMCSLTMNSAFPSRPSTLPVCAEEDENEMATKSRKRVRRLSITEAGDFQEYQTKIPKVKDQPLFSSLPQIIPGVASVPAVSGPAIPTTSSVNIHPPPMYYPVSNGMPSTPHRVHPPPYPGTDLRSIARLPSPSKRKTSSTSPITPKATPLAKGERSPSSKLKTPSPPQRMSSFGGMTFVNFTSDDADVLLSGVARSGTSGKKKRDREDSGDEHLSKRPRSRSDDE
ncbi:hypothetical protein C348_04893 [Cryptococcus neoformans Gb118]|nr:hypothetical protein C350_04648 [Cryptococcus neoformans var. grubii MW-RSA36]OXL07097.1 hypothetical protein C348_04893 [Cryptococcus neoformans var. grubii Gb118]